MRRKILFLAVLLSFLCFSTNLFAKEKWKEHKSRHFIVYYQKAPFDFIKTVDEAAEDYYYEITDNLGFSRDQIWSFDDRARIYIYDDSDHYVDSARQARWSSGSTILGSKIIRTFPSAHGFFDSVLPHELGHIIFREYVGFKTKIPLWMDEGVAMYQEKAKRFGVNGEVKRALENETFIPISKLSKMRLTRSSSRAAVDLFYAEAASIVYFLIADQGRFRFMSFCRNLKQGNSFEQSLHKAYGRFKDTDDLNRAWVNYLK
ncbi:MAG: peptidase MA family metallohydrolase [Candidatus Aceula meridiana]|nr:peptidase MA family metallohydrolase [Candidatus Aceula meridiana]